ncbi:MAG TPA: isocitrate lyase/phosphoenolpyruvate mutase family protein [Acidimicrobiia bacterium]|nr:isocitrate lyase/phosphoenolpyruvate mutase family protein [Acidimicrobiia bacterium]
MAPTSVAARRTRFADLHTSGTFVMPNAWDTGSAMVLQSLGFDALATTSSGFAASLGRPDQSVTLSELVGHVRDLCALLEVPISVDSEFGYSADLAGLSRTVGQLAAAGAAGVSIEDHLPGRGVIGVEEATDRVGRFTEAAHAEDLMVTARAENHLYGIEDLDDTIARLHSYRSSGADVLYAPGLSDIEEIARLVREVSAPVNVLLATDGPTVAELTEVGVRRLSTGGSLAFVAYGAVASAARELIASGTTGFASGALTGAERATAFRPGPN